MGSRLLRGMICPHYAGNFLSPRPLGLFQPPLQSSQQNPISGLHLPLHLRVFHGSKRLLCPNVLAHLLQQVACELSPVVRYYTLGHVETAHNILPHETLDFVRGDLGYWFCLNPFREVLDRHKQILHLPDRQREGSQNVDSPRVERPGAVD